jgi:hypothetical protein
MIGMAADSRSATAVCTTARIKALRSPIAIMTMGSHGSAMSGVDQMPDRRDMASRVAVPDALRGINVAWYLGRRHIDDGVGVHEVGCTQAVAPTPPWGKVRSCANNRVVVSVR